MKTKYKELTDLESKQIMLELLNVFDDFCTHYKLKYSLSAGTLLGAIRHKGFIPWDDDLDVMMPRQDYIFFSNHFSSWVRGDKIRVVGPKTPKFYMLFSKIIATNTIVVQSDRTIRIGVWIDVFPVDYVQKEPYDAYDEMIYYAKQFYYLGDHNFFLKIKEQKGIKKVVAFFINIKRFIARFAKKRYYLNRHFSFIKKHKGDKSMCFYSPAVIKIWYDVSNVDFSNLSNCKFEDREYKIINNWDEYLTVHYGDYLTIPPVEERATHKCQTRKIKV